MPKRPSSGFRADVEGLRALAILAVVLYHAGIGGFGGGYVGVDVFFVLSGFLITGLLWRGLTKDGRVSFAQFYARRARRLLPLAVLVVILTLFASALALPPLEVKSVMKDAAAAILYVPNFRFALQSTNYLAASATPSPLQHYWSLGVEEQFYLLWPALLLLLWHLARLSRRRSASPEAVGITILAALGVASFALSLWLTHASQPWAFFSLPTRAWELIAGGLVALAARWLKALPAVGAAVLGWGGLAAVAWSVTRFSGTTPFPGLAALLPVAGTAAVLIAGTRRQHAAGAPAGPMLILRQEPLQVIGKLSYAWYLWHWPVLILAPQILHRSLGVWDNLGLVLFSLLLTVASVALVELPIRFHPSLVKWPRLNLGLATTFMTAGLLSVGLVAVSLPSLQGHGKAPVATLGSAAGAKSSASVGGSGGNSADQTPGPVDPLGQPAAAETAKVAAAVAASVGVEDVPANLTPSISEAKADEPPVFVDGCLDSYTDTKVRSCTFGDTTSTTQVFLIGDSHASMWFPALDGLAKARSWRLVALGKATCPPLEITVRSPELGRTFTECNEWRANVMARIAATKPALVVLGVARHYSSLYDITVYDQQWVQGLAATVAQIRSLGSQVVVLGPIPKPPADVPTCLSAHLTTAAACTVPLAQSVNAAGIAAEQAATVQAGGAYLDLIPWFCTASTCAAMVDNLLVWRDDNHVTASYAAYLAPAAGAEIDLLTNGRV